MDLDILLNNNFTLASLLVGKSRELARTEFGWPG
jgi:hypothetical protein